MELSKHIEILLLWNDCVIVPGFGGFTASHVPARFDEADGLFIPPLRTLGFNPKLNVNDSLLAQSYTEAYDISYPEALKRIADETNELKQHLGNDGSYTLNDIGTLYMTENGSIGFTPCESGVLTPDLYSLSSFDMKCIDTDMPKRERESVRKQDTKRLIASIQPVDASVKPTADAAVEEVMDDEDNERTIKIRLSVLRNVAAILIAVITFFALSSPINNSGSTIRQSQMESGIFSSLISNSHKEMKSAVGTNAAAAVKSSVGKTADTENAAANSQAKVSEAPHEYFCIVLASQVTHKNAAAFAERMVSAGYKTTRVLDEKGRSTKVVYGSYNSKTEAYNALNELNGEDNFQDAWVYQVKH